MSDSAQRLRQCADTMRQHKAASIDAHELESAADEIDRLRSALNRVRTSIFNIENRACTPVFVTTEIDLIDAALRGPEKP
ncbi:hypothetical protein [Roseibium sp. Sym1]|uniref:hypothetical protein n=1 Tax=Roseibium sp. Sym1 TaxID=3016006 RepID=UPI0022B31C62|nr:hypothetical protein [Roseibium sp. Sym1]